MTENKPTQNTNDDPLASLHRMSTTAGAASQEYVAINLAAVTALVLGLASTLVLLSQVLLILPVACLIFGIVALKQISNSNGTQTGRGMAWLGMVLALGMVGVIGGREYRTYADNKRELVAIDAVVKTLEQDIKAQRYDQIVNSFTDGFLARKQMTPAQFANRWKELNGNPLYGSLKSLSTNGRVGLSQVAAGGTREGGTMLVIQFDKTEQVARFDAMFRKTGNAWKIEDIPRLFPPPASEMPTPGGGQGPAM